MALMRSETVRRALRLAMIAVVFVVAVNHDGGAVRAASTKRAAYGSNTTSPSRTFTFTVSSSPTDSPSLSLSESETASDSESATVSESPTESGTPSDSITDASGSPSLTEPSATSEITASATDSATPFTRSESGGTASPGVTPTEETASATGTGGGGIAAATLSGSVSEPTSSASATDRNLPLTETSTPTLGVTESDSTSDPVTGTVSLTYKAAPLPPFTPDAVSTGANIAGLSAGTTAAVVAGFVGLGPATGAAAARGVNMASLLDRCRIGGPTDPILLPFPVSLFPGYGLEAEDSPQYYQRGAVAAACIVLLTVFLFGFCGVVLVAMTSTGAFPLRFHNALAKSRFPGIVAAMTALVAAIVAPSSVALALGASRGSSPAPNTDIFLSLGGFLVEAGALAALLSIAKQRVTRPANPEEPCLGFVETIIVDPVRASAYEIHTVKAHDTLAKRFLFWGFRAWRAPFTATPAARKLLLFSSQRHEATAAFVRGPDVTPAGALAAGVGTNAPPLDVAAAFYLCIELLLTLSSGSVIGVAWHHPASPENCVAASAVALSADVLSLLAIVVLRPFTIPSLNVVAALVALMQFGATVSAAVAMSELNVNAVGATELEESARTHAGGFAVAALFLTLLFPLIIVGRWLLLGNYELRAAPRASPASPAPTRKKKQDPLSPESGGSPAARRRVAQMLSASPGADVENEPLAYDPIAIGVSRALAEQHHRASSPAPPSRAVSFHGSPTDRRSVSVRDFERRLLDGVDDEDDGLYFHPAVADGGGGGAAAYDTTANTYGSWRRAREMENWTGSPEHHQQRDGGGSGIELQSAAVHSFVRDVWDDDAGTTPHDGGLSSAAPAARSATASPPALPQVRRKQQSPFSAGRRQQEHRDLIDDLL